MKHIGELVIVIVIIMVHIKAYPISEKIQHAERVEEKEKNLLEKLVEGMTGVVENVGNWAGKVISDTNEGIWGKVISMAQAVKPPTVNLEMKFALPSVDLEKLAKLPAETIEAIMKIPGFNISEYISKIPNLNVLPKLPDLNPPPKIPGSNPPPKNPDWNLLPKIPGLDELGKLMGLGPAP
uniref:TXNDC11 protein n=1 Tax=Fopius arisanus TaxID=64838 RepID=A0A0C9QKY5_9HYME